MGNESAFAIATGTGAAQTRGRRAQRCTSNHGRIRAEICSASDVAVGELDVANAVTPETSYLELRCRRALLLGRTLHGQFEATTVAPEARTAQLPMTPWSPARNQ